MAENPLFHLAVPVDDLDAARRFYGQTLACPEGRSSDQWIDFDLGGHQLVVHRAPREEEGPSSEVRNQVDRHQVPVPHFGLVLSVPEFEALASRLKAAGTTFEIEPTLRFAGTAGEQRTMFFRDPAGNALEFKAFANRDSLFRKDLHS